MVVAEVSGEAAESGEALVVESDDAYVLALVVVLGGDGVEGGDGGCVPDVGLGQVDDHVLGVADVVELVDEVVAGGEAQLAEDAVDAGVVVGVGDVDDLGESPDCSPAVGRH
ncbi:MAG: hypothetical protein WCF36_04350 [Candidatus Nanopelagicales bacterium]